MLHYDLLQLIQYLRERKVVVSFVVRMIELEISSDHYVPGGTMSTFLNGLVAASVSVSTENLQTMLSEMENTTIKSVADEFTSTEKVSYYTNCRERLCTRLMDAYWGVNGHSKDLLVRRFRVPKSWHTFRLTRNCCVQQPLNFEVECVTNRHANSRNSVCPNIYERLKANNSGLSPFVKLEFNPVTRSFEPEDSSLEMDDMGVGEHVRQKHDTREEFLKAFVLPTRINYSDKAIYRFKHSPVFDLNLVWHILAHI
jgi:hypothetical protein